MIGKGCSFVKSYSCCFDMQKQFCINPSFLMWPTTYLSSWLTLKKRVLARSLVRIKYLKQKQDLNPSCSSPANLYIYGLGTKLDSVPDRDPISAITPILGLVPVPRLWIIVNIILTSLSKSLSI